MTDSISTSAMPSLYPYQRAWIEDNSRFKIACKARQIGFTYAAAWRVVDVRLRREGLTLWVSASERQALEAMEHIRRFARELDVAAINEETFIDATSVRQHSIRFKNGSRIIALPSNPDTVRGFAGDIVLDEFAFHRDADEIWRAAFAIATRGHQLEVISTPNGARGRYYEIAKAAGLVDRTAAHAGPEEVLGTRRTADPWSAHWIDLSLARQLGFVVDAESLRAAIADDDAWQQEYCCCFLAHAAYFLPPELVVAAESPEAATGPPFTPKGAEFIPPTAGEGTPPLSVDGVQRPVTTVSETGARRLVTTVSETGGQRLVTSMAGQGFSPDKKFAAIAATTEGAWGKPSSGSPAGQPTGHLFLGVDIGRHRDLTVLWFLECENPRAPVAERSYITRGVVTLEKQPFTSQRATLDSFLSERIEKRKPKSEDRGTKPVFEFRSSSFVHVVSRCAVDATGMGAMLAEELGERWGSRVEEVVFTNAVKEQMAVRVKRLLEDRRLKIPYDPKIRAAFNSIKRVVTAAGNVRFDADRTDESGHADAFWALALALEAADQSGPSVDFTSTEAPRAFARSSAY